MHLVDTNIWLELLLAQERAEDVREFLSRMDTRRLAITEFTLYSIGLILLRLKKPDALNQFIADVVISGGVNVIRLSPLDFSGIIAYAARFMLDFDDAYQYAAAEKHDLVIVSFDSDFDRTERGRRGPTQIRPTSEQASG